MGGRTSFVVPMTGQDMLILWRLLCIWFLYRCRWEQRRSATETTLREISQSDERCTRHGWLGQVKTIDYELPQICRDGAFEVFVSAISTYFIGGLPLVQLSVFAYRMHSKATNTYFHSLCTVQGNAKVESLKNMKRRLLPDCS